jgi:hypothetical protein
MATPTDKAAAAAREHVTSVQRANRKRKAFEPVLEKAAETGPCAICSEWKQDVRDLPCGIADHCMCYDCVLVTRKRNLEGRLVIFCSFCERSDFSTGWATGSLAAEEAARAGHTIAPAPISLFFDRPTQLRHNNKNEAFMRNVFGCRFCEWSGSMADYDAHRKSCTSAPEECPCCGELVPQERCGKHATEFFENHLRDLLDEFQEQAEKFEAVVREQTLALCRDQDEKMESLRALIVGVDGAEARLEGERALAELCHAQALLSAPEAPSEPDTVSAIGILSSKITATQLELKVTTAALVRCRATVDEGYKPGSRERAMLAADSRQLLYDRVTCAVKALLDETHRRVTAFESAEWLPTSAADVDFAWGKAVLSNSRQFQRAAVLLHERVVWICRHSGRDLVRTLEEKVCPAIAEMVVDEAGSDVWWRLLVGGGSEFNVEDEFTCPFRDALCKIPSPVTTPGLFSPERQLFESKASDVFAAWATKRRSALGGVVNALEQRGRLPLRLFESLCMDGSGLTLGEEQRRAEMNSIVRRLMKAVLVHNHVLRRKYAAIDVDYSLTTKNNVNTLRYICGVKMEWPFCDLEMAGGAPPYSDAALAAQGILRSPWIVTRQAAMDPIEVDTDDEGVPPQPTSPSYSPLSPSYVHPVPLNGV